MSFENTEQMIRNQTNLMDFKSIFQDLPSSKNKKLQFIVWDSLKLYHRETTDTE